MGTHVLPVGGWKIHNYKIPENILMGFEYEVQAEFSHKNKFKNLLPKHYTYAWESFNMNHCGFEIKSSVAPLKTLKQEVNKIYPLLLLGPKSATDSHGGIHINISKNKYTKEHHEKVFLFLHNRLFYKFFLRLSNRNETSFGTWTHQVDDINTRNEWQKGCYNGIITTRKSYAYEMRMFGAQPDLLVPALEMCHALFSLAEEVDEIEMEDFIDYTHSYLRYKNIKELIKKVI